jgi:tRNA A37 threonylcarbamoyladenosine biosynthesis protein TsaE
VAVEWYDRFRATVPRDHLEVRLHVASETTRRLDAIAHGPASERLLAALTLR